MGSPCTLVWLASLPWLLTVTACSSHALPGERADRPPPASHASTQAPVEAPPEAQPRPQPAPAAARPSVRWGVAGPLKYLEVVPPGVDPQRPLPMVLFVHGLGDRPRPAFVDGLQLPVRFILPQAPTPHGRGYSWFPYRVGDPHPDFAVGIARSAGLLVEMMAALASERPTTGLPILTGFSQGGILSYAVALHHPEAIAVAHPIAGMLPEALWPQGGAGEGPRPPIRAVHGSADGIVPHAAADALVRTLAARGFDITLQSFEGVRHTQSLAMRRAMVELLRDSLAGRVPARASSADVR